MSTDCATPACSTLIAGSKSAEDPEYKTFVEQTGLDYRTDLDAVAAAFAEGNTYLALRGRFVSKKLAAYAQSHGGKCEGAALFYARHAQRLLYFVRASASHRSRDGRFDRRARRQR